MVKYSKYDFEGTSSIIVGAQNAESKKLAFEFYISNSRKKTLDAKLLKIIDKKGFSAVSQFIEGKSLKSIAVTLGEANIDVILQKVDTGELEIVSAEQVENADGTFSIVLIVKPPTQGDNQ